MSNRKEVARSALVLTLIAGAVAAALAGTNVLTADTIAARTAAVEDAARRQVMEADTFEAGTLTAPDGGEVTYHTALRDGTVAGYVFTAQAVGKSAGLTVMTGISADGSITGVVITEDNETAGYVDKVEKAGLLEQLKGTRADTYAASDVDAVAQATKTSKGVAKAVDTAVGYYRIIMEEGQA